MSTARHMSIRQNPSGDWPVIHPSACVDSTAQVIGNVKIGSHVFVGPNAVIRADEPDDSGHVCPVIVEDECNLQDGVIIHALGGTEVNIGTRTSLAHGAIVHGPCKIGEGCFVGFGAVVFKTQLGRGVFVASRSVVENVDIPADTFIPAVAFISQDQISQLRKTDPKERSFMADVVQANLGLAEGYLGLTQARGDRP